MYVLIDRERILKVCLPVLQGLHALSQLSKVALRAKGHEDPELPYTAEHAFAMVEHQLWTVIHVLELWQQEVDEEMEHEIRVEARYIADQLAKTPRHFRRVLTIVGQLLPELQENVEARLSLFTAIGQTQQTLGQPITMFE